MTRLAEGWRWSTLDDLTSGIRANAVIGPFGSDLRVSDYTVSGVKLVFVRDIRSGDFTANGPCITVEKAARLRAHEVRSGDLLITKMGDPPGETAIYDQSEPAIITADCIRLRLSQEFDSRFISYSFASDEVRRQIESVTRGAAQKKVSLDRLRKSLRIPTPSVVDQCRIADLLDLANDFRAGRRQALGLLDELRASIFLDMFGAEAQRSVTLQSGETHPAGWSWVPLGEVAQLATGHTPDRATPEYWDGDIPWISLPEIRRLDGKTAWDTDLRVTSSGVAHSSAVVLPAGTVCFSRTASIGFVTKLGRPMATSQDFHNWIPKERIESDFLLHALRVSRPHLLGASDGSTHKTIYQRIAQKFLVLLPPITLQREFVDRMRLLDLAKDRSTRHGAHADQLTQTLQQRAFAGQL